MLRRTIAVLAGLCIPAFALAAGEAHAEDRGSPLTPALVLAGATFLTAAGKFVVDGFNAVVGFVHVTRENEGLRADLEAARRERDAARAQETAERARNDAKDERNDRLRRDNDQLRRDVLQAGRIGLAAGGITVEPTLPAQDAP
jgi:hypothetical protein